MGYLDWQGADRTLLRETLERTFSPLDLMNVAVETYPRLRPKVPWQADLATVVATTIDKANEHGVLDRLVVALAAERPFIEALRVAVLNLSRYPGWSPRLDYHGLDLKRGLEGLTSPGGAFFDTTRLARWLIRTERQVCRVRCGKALGTGFLIGPDLVLTCFHVVEKHLINAVPANQVAVHFDYRRDEKGNDPVEKANAWIGIDPAWTIPRSPYSAKDISLVGEPGENELDYAILKLGRAVGDETPHGEDQPRRWVDLSADRPLPERETPILIVQHPGVPNSAPPAQEPLQITFHPRGFEDETSSGVRVAYRPSTLPGSSGSPVYDGSLAAVALHHNRGQIDPTAKDLHTNNRGIPLAKIRAHLSQAIRDGLLPAE